jgi:hypothetical protein
MTTIKIESDKIFTHSLAALSRGDWFQLAPGGDLYIKLHGDTAFDVRSAFEIDVKPSVDVIYHPNISIVI